MNPVFLRVQGGGCLVADALIITGNGVLPDTGDFPQFEAMKKAHPMRRKSLIDFAVNNN